jgi:hypothetical protein
VEDVGSDDGVVQRYAEAVETGQAQLVHDDVLVGEGAAGTAVIFVTINLQ